MYEYDVIIISPVSPMQMFSVLVEIILCMDDATTRPLGDLNSGKVLNRS